MPDMEEIFVAVLLTVIGVVFGMWVYHMYVHDSVIRGKIAKGELTPEGTLWSATEETPA